MARALVCPLKAAAKKDQPSNMWDHCCSSDCAWFTGPQDAPLPTIMRGQCILWSIANAIATNKTK
jgi:hypothetical protein